MLAFCIVFRFQHISFAKLFLTLIDSQHIMSKKKAQNLTDANAYRPKQYGAYRTICLDVLSFHTTKQCTYINFKVTKSSRNFYISICKHSSVLLFGAKFYFGIYFQVCESERQSERMRAKQSTSVRKDCPSSFQVKKNILLNNEREYFDLGFLFFPSIRGYVCFMLSFTLLPIFVLQSIVNVNSNGVRQ